MSVRAGRELEAGSDEGKDGGGAKDGKKPRRVGKGQGDEGMEGGRMKGREGREENEREEEGAGKKGDVRSDARKYGCEDGIGKGRGGR